MPPIQTPGLARYLQNASRVRPPEYPLDGLRQELFFGSVQTLEGTLAGMDRNAVTTVLVISPTLLSQSCVTSNAMLWWTIFNR